MASSCSPRVTRLGALLLVAVATFGVAMPRARVTARERVGRAIAIRLASPRINDRFGWVAPDPRVAPIVRASGQPLRPTDVTSRTSQTSLAPWRRVAAPPVAVVGRASGADADEHAVSPGHRHRTFGRPPPQA